jgi:hypothetical protein
VIIDILPFVATVSSAAATPFIAVYRAWRRRVGTARNEADRCALCGSKWGINANDTVDAYLVEGQLLCEACAPRMRHRTIAAISMFVAAAGVSFYFGWGPIIEVISTYGLVDGLMSLTRWAWLMFALPPALVAGSASWAMRTMKRDNKRALESLARARLLAPPV